VSFGRRRGAVNLYYYPGPSVTVVKATWVLTRFVTIGIVIGTLILFGVVKLNESVADTIEAGSMNALKAENVILRQQITLIAPRLTRVEAQADQLRERTNGLHKLLRKRNDVRDRGLSLTSFTGKSGAPFTMVAAKNPLP
jgi:hypothetical protein